MSEDLTLIVGGRAISGWTDITVTRGIERVPGGFSIGLTELFPGELNDVVVQPGDACQVKIGIDAVVTGYVDRFIPSISAGRHSVHVTGRGKCQDLVDCAAEWPNGQISGSSVLEIAKKLSSPYGINASGLDGRAIPQFNLNYGETAWEVIERLCRYSAILPYEIADGSLYLANVGDRLAASGFIEGQNVLAASIEYSMDQRYSEYITTALSVDTFSELGSGGFFVQTVKDPAVTRNRKRMMVAESGDQGLDISKLRGVWEMNRRVGHSQVIRLTADSWRDSAGDLWEPNTLVSVSLPKLKLPDVVWTIGEVTYRRSGAGTTVDVVIMAPGAFSPQPILLFPAFRDIPDFSKPQ